MKGVVPIILVIEYQIGGKIGKRIRGKRIRGKKIRGKTITIPAISNL